MANLEYYLGDKKGGEEKQLVGTVNYIYSFEKHLLSGDVFTSIELNAIEEVICGLIKKYNSLRIFDLGNLLGFNVNSAVSPKFIEDISEEALLKKSVENLIYHHQIYEIGESKYKLTLLGEKGTAINKMFKCNEKYPFEVFVDSFSQYNINISKILSNIKYWEEISDLKITKSREEYLLITENQRPEVINNNLSQYCFTENITLLDIENFTAILPVNIYYNYSSKEFDLIALIDSDENLEFSKGLNSSESEKSKILKNLKFQLVSQSGIIPDTYTLEEFIEKWDWDLLSQASSIPFDEGYLLAFIDKWNWLLISQNPSVLFTDKLIQGFLNNWDWDRVSQNRSFLTKLDLVEVYSEKLNWKIISNLDNEILTEAFINTFRELLQWSILSKNLKFKIDNNLLHRYQENFDWNVERSEFLPIEIQEIEIYQKYINFNHLLPYLEPNKIISIDIKGIIFANKDRIKPISLERIQFTSKIIDIFAEYDLIKWESKRWTERVVRTRFKWDGSEDWEDVISKEDLGFFDNEFLKWDISLFNKYQSNLFEFCDNESISKFINRISASLSLELGDPILDSKVLNWDQLLINPNIKINEQFLKKYIDRINWEIASGVAQVYENDSILQKFNDSLNWNIIIEKREKIINSNTFIICYQNIDQKIFFNKYEDQVTAEFLSETFNIINWENVSSTSNENLLKYEVINNHSDHWNWDVLSSNENLKIDTIILINFSHKWNWQNLSRNESMDGLDPWALLPYSESLDWLAYATDKRVTTFLSKIEWDLMNLKEQVDTIINLSLKFPNEWIWCILKLNKHLPFLDEILLKFDKSVVWDEIINDTRFHLDIANIEKHKQNINWSTLTNSKRLLKNINVLTHFENQWDWSILSRNASIYQDLSVVQSFGNKLSWDLILESCDKDLSKEIVFEFRNQWIIPFAKARQNFEMALENFDQKFNNQNHYIANSDFLKWREENSSVNHTFNSIIFENPFVQKFGNKYLPKYVKDVEKILTKPEDVIAAFNSIYINKEIKKCEGLFNDIAGVSLDEQQRKCIITDEDNNLVVAGAGSGKTMTIAGKVKYLTKRKRISPDNILLITFTRKAMEEMEDRVVKKMGIDIEVRTFNSLGLNIIGKAEGSARPSLRDDGEIRKFLNDCFIGLSSQPEYQSVLQEYFAYYLKLYKPLTEFKNQGEYILYIKENNLSFKSIEVSTKGTVSLFKEQLKSQEEVEIANFLHLNNIKYEYEKPYPINLADEDYIQYRPDFYLPDYDIYIEHFAFIDELGNVPDWFRSDIKKKSYFEAAKWKREIHCKHNTLLIESYSYEKSRGVLKENLKIKLENQGVKFNPKPLEEVDEIIKKYYKPELRKFSDLLQTYLTLLKQSRQTLEDVERKSGDLDFNEKLRFDKFMDVFKPIYAMYSDFLGSNFIDFSDMINRAIDHIDQKRYFKSYDYIIIDEFQDTSINRGLLIKSLRSLNENCKLFCVGDDWQSIYRFAGSDISLFTNFEAYFGKAHISEIETTYRFDNSIIELSSNFVLKNQNQLTKNLKSKKNVEIPTFEIVYYSNEIEELKKTFEKINYLADGKEKSILILGRYQNSFTNIIESDDFSCSKTQDTLIYKKYPKLKITKLTVHKSKGLGADFVVVLGCNNGKYGFPSELNDDAVLKTVLSEADQFPNGEERRLFYVAMTRTKEYLWLFANKDQPSKFIKELDIEKKIHNDDIPECNECKDGTKMKLQIKKATNESFWGCSNYPMCNFTISN